MWSWQLFDIFILTYSKLKTGLLLNIFSRFLRDDSSYSALCNLITQGSLFSVFSLIDNLLTPQHKNFINTKNTSFTIQPPHMTLKM